jgi:hypothetical protein
MNVAFKSRRLFRDLNAKVVLAMAEKFHLTTDENVKSSSQRQKEVLLMNCHYREVCIKSIKL